MTIMALNLRLAEQTDQKLNELAAAAGTSKQQVIASLVEKQWNEQEARRVAHRRLEEIYERRRGLIERLSDA